RVVVADPAVLQCQRDAEVADAAGVAAHRRVLERQLASACVDDAGAAARVSTDRAVTERQRALVADAAGSAGAARGTAGDGDPFECGRHTLRDGDRRRSATAYRRLLRAGADHADVLRDREAAGIGAGRDG